MPEVRVLRRHTAAGALEASVRVPVSVRVPSDDAPLLATALMRSFELVAGIALFALTATAIVVVLIPSSASARAGFAVELVFLGLALVVLALLLSRRSARAVMQPLEVLDAALASITAGDLTVRVQLDRAAAEIRFVGESVNTMVRELSRLQVIERETAKDLRLRRELSEVVHASLDLDHVVQRAVEVVGDALDVDRVHIRLREHDDGRLAAEWRRAVNIARLAPVSPGDELFSLIHLIGVTDDRNAVVIEDTTDAARFSTEQRAAFEELSMSAVLKYPIVVGARVAGALVVSEQTGSRSWSDGEVGLMEGFAREIGRALDHALAYQLQNQMVERLGVLDRSKNDFLSEVSRELRGPLASVLGYIELLTDEASETVTDEQRRMLGIVERNGEQLLELIADLLTMSKMEAGEFEPKLASVDLDRVIAQAWDAIAPAAANGGLTLQLNVEPGIELDGDEKQIERALRNILLNAVKFTPGGGRIDLFARVEGGEILLQVRDTGVGIAARELDDLFTRFFSASGVRRRETFGAGLGLYIVKQIVDGHAGSVSVASVLGHGSTFTMRFPVRPKHPSRRASDERLVRS